MSPARSWPRRWPVSRSAEAEPAGADEGSPSDHSRDPSGAAGRAHSGGLQPSPAGPGNRACRVSVLASRRTDRIEADSIICSETTAVTPRLTSIPRRTPQLACLLVSMVLVAAGCASGSTRSPLASPSSRGMRPLPRARLQSPSPGRRASSRTAARVPGQAWPRQGRPAARGRAWPRSTPILATQALPVWPPTTRSW